MILLNQQLRRTLKLHIKPRGEEVAYTLKYMLAVHVCVYNTLAAYGNSAPVLPPASAVLDGRKLPLLEWARCYIKTEDVVAAIKGSIERLLGKETKHLEWPSELYDNAITEFCDTVNARKRRAAAVCETFIKNLFILLCNFF